MSIAILLQQILIIFLEIGTGAAVTKLGIMDDRNSKFLSNLVMSVRNGPGGVGGAGQGLGRKGNIFLYSCDNQKKRS